MQNGLTPKQQRLNEFDYENSLKDFYYFSKRILKYDFKPLPHREMCGVIQDELKYKLILGPRGCFKTSVISQAYAVWRIVKDPNITILLDSVSLTNSKDNIGVIENHLRHNNKLRELYGEHYGRKQTWNTEECVSALRTDMKLKDPTVRAAGIDKIQIGTHYDLIIADDLHDVDNSKTAEQVQKVKKHIKLLFGLLKPGGEIIIAGTRWSYTDAFSMLLGDTEDVEELELSELFKGGTLIRSCINEQGQLYFPDELDHEHIKRQRIAMGANLYAAQMMNEPILAGENQTFSQRNFQLYKELPEDLNLYLTIDPGGEIKKSDVWVFFLGGMSAEHMQYFIDYEKKICTASQAADIIYKFWKRPLVGAHNDALKNKKLRKIGFEITGQQRVILTSIKDFIFNKYKVAIPFTELQHSKESKTSRIEAMGPYYEQRKILHSPKMSVPYGLEAQLLRFTKAADDIADAASMQKEVARAPMVVVPVKKATSLDEMIAMDEQGLGQKIHRVHPVLGSDY